MKERSDLGGGQALSQGEARSIKVRMGYGWQKFSDDEPKANGREILHDEFWQSLKALFDPWYKGFNEKHDIQVSFGRLRANHGRLVWPCIAKKIDDAYLLVFDVAASPNDGIPQCGKVKFEEVVTELNSNVLIELGYALGKGKQVILMCPKHLFHKVPSDLKGFLWTQYTCVITDKGLKRTLVDQYGAQNAFLAILREIENKITGKDNDD